MVKRVLQDTEDTIVAPVTPEGRAGMHVVRVSGPATTAVLRACFRPLGGGRRTEPWRQYLGWLYERGDRLEKVTVCFMKGPRSYTGDDSFEVYCHGGPQSRRAVVELLLGLGCRPALPGEFTARAFLNGKMDLAQAEAVAAVIGAGSETGRRYAVRQLQGGFSRQLSEIRGRVLAMLAGLEADIDQLCDESPAERKVLKRGLLSLAETVEHLWGAARRGGLLNDGFRCVIVGFANAGKSTLFNSLLGRERVITSSRAGTTRDVIEEAVDIGGRSVTVADTAGLELAGGELERKATNKSLRQLVRADMLLLTVDVSRKLKGDEVDRLARVTRGRRVVLVYNKVDLAPRLERKGAAWRRLARGKKRVETTATSGRGIAALRRLIAAGHDAVAGDGDEGLLLSPRQYGVLKEMRKHVSEAVARADEGEEVLVAEGLKGVLEGLATLSGERVSEAVLEEIFSRFCVGK